MASIEDSGSFDHSSNLCGTKYLFYSLFLSFLLMFILYDMSMPKTPVDIYTKRTDNGYTQQTNKKH